MKEFLFKSPVQDLSKKLNLTRNDICLYVLNAELGTMYTPGSALSSYPRLTTPINEEEIMERIEAEELQRELRKI